MDRLDLDQLNSTHLSDGVWEAMLPFLRGPTASPQATHRLGLKAREALESARSEFQALFGGCGADSILFTSGASEAVNQAIKGTAWAVKEGRRHLVATNAEHPAVVDSIRFLVSQGWEATWVGVDPVGGIDPAKLLEALRGDTALVATHWVNHDLGTIQPAAEIATELARREIPLFLDATGCCGCLPTLPRETGASLMALDPARLGGPHGVGVLYRAKEHPLRPLLHGGIQEHGLRGGAENIAACAGAAAAMRELGLGDSIKGGQFLPVQSALLAGLRSLVPRVRLNGPEPGPRRAPNHLNFSVEGLEAEGLALRLDLRGLAVGSRTGCIARDTRVPAAMAAIGVPEELATAAVLLSWRNQLSQREIDRALELLSQSIAFLRQMSPAWEDKSLGIRPFLASERW